MGINVNFFAIIVVVGITGKDTRLYQRNARLSRLGVLHAESLGQDDVHLIPRKAFFACIAIQREGEINVFLRSARLDRKRRLNVHTLLSNNGTET